MEQDTFDHVARDCAGFVGPWPVCKVVIQRMGKKDEGMHGQDEARSGMATSDEQHAGKDEKDLYRNICVWSAPAWCQARAVATMTVDPALAVQTRREAERTRHLRDAVARRAADHAARYGYLSSSFAWSTTLFGSVAARLLAQRMSRREVRAAAAAVVQTVEQVQAGMTIAVSIDVLHDEQFCRRLEHQCLHGHEGLAMRLAMQATPADRGSSTTDTTTTTTTVLVGPDMARSRVVHASVYLELPPAPLLPSTMWGCKRVSVRASVILSGRDTGSTMLGFSAAEHIADVLCSVERLADHHDHHHHQHHHLQQQQQRTQQRRPWDCAVFASGALHPRARALLESRGITPVGHVLGADARAVAQLTGASVVRNALDLHRDHVGTRVVQLSCEQAGWQFQKDARFVHRIASARRTQQRRFLVVERAPESDGERQDTRKGPQLGDPIAVQLCAASELQCVCLQHQFSRCCARLRQVATDRSVLPGGGAIETMIRIVLQERPPDPVSTATFTVLIEEFCVVFDKILVHLMSALPSWEHRVSRDPNQALAEHLQQARAPVLEWYSALPKATAGQRRRAWVAASLVPIFDRQEQGTGSATAPDYGDGDAGADADAAVHDDAHQQVAAVSNKWPPILDCTSAKRAAFAEAMRSAIELACMSELVLT